MASKTAWFGVSTMATFQNGCRRSSHVAVEVLHQAGHDQKWTSLSYGGRLTFRLRIPPMTSIPGAADAAEVAALEQLPVDSRGFRRTLRLHAVTVQADGPGPVSVCGYRYRPEELRAERRWDSVTPSGRCALCEVQVRRRRQVTADEARSTGEEGGIDLVDARTVDLTERSRLPEDQPERPRLSLVRDAGSERRSTDRT
jgi:hypothetical protein